MRHTDWSESAQLHPQKHQLPCKSLWLICLEISEELTCSRKDEQTGTQPGVLQEVQPYSIAGKGWKLLEGSRQDPKPDTWTAWGLPMLVIRTHHAKRNENPSRCRACNWEVDALAATCLSSQGHSSSLDLKLTHSTYTEVRLLIAMQIDSDWGNNWHGNNNEKINC